MSKSVYYQTANPQAVKVPSFDLKLVFKFRFKIFFFEVDDVIAGDVIVFVLKKGRIVGSNWK